MTVASESRRRISKSKALLFSFFLLMFVSAGLESIARLVMAPPQLDTGSEALPFWVLSNMKESNFIPHRLLFWRVPASTHRLHTNSLGLRGPEFSARKEPGVYRIITLGDSCTWGFGVSPGLEYPNQLQILLNQSYVPKIFEVQNAGVPGYSSLQGLRYLESELIHYNPDLITLYFGRNDHRKLQEEGGYAPDHEVPIPSEFVVSVQQILNHLRIYQKFRSEILNLRSSQSTGNETVGRGLSKRAGRQFRVEPDEFEANFRSMIKLAKSHKTQVYAITAPVFPSSVGNYNEIVKSICREEAIWTLDAETEFMQHNHNGWLVDECHPNEAGHAWIADSLKTKLFLDLETTHFP